MDKIKIILWVTVLIFSPIATASLITYDGQGKPVNFSGLVYGDTTYDVDILWDSSFNLTYGLGVDYQQPLFIDNSDGAWAIASIFLDELISDNYVPFQYVASIVIPYSLTPAGFNAAGTSIFAMSPLGAGLYSRDLVLPYRGYTVFTSRSVPEPSVLALMFTGVMGLGIARRYGRK